MKHAGMQVRLMGLNPIGGATAPLLFSWEELPYTHLWPPGPNSDAGGPCSSASPQGESQHARRWSLASALCLRVPTCLVPGSLSAV